MTQPDVETLYRWYEALRRGDKEGCVRESTADVEIVSYLMGVEGTVYSGHAGVRGYIDDVFAIFPDWHPQIVGTSEHGDTVIAQIRMAGRGASSGLEIEQTTWQVTSFREGKMSGFTAYGSQEAALGAVNAEIVRCGFEAWDRSDYEAVSRHFSPEVEIDVSERVLNPAVYRGMDGAARFREEIEDTWDEFHVEVEDLLPAGDVVVVLVHSTGRGRASGAQVDARAAWVAAVSEQQVTRLRLYRERSEALQAVGLAG